MILNIVTGQIKQPRFLSQASRFYLLRIEHGGLGVKRGALFKEL